MKHKKTLIKMKEYNLYFEHISKMRHDLIIQEVNIKFKSFSVLDVVGYWLGFMEKSKCIKIILMKPTPTNIINIHEIIDFIKSVNQQECVLLTVNEVDAILV